MTDNEIKKALVCCILSECENCPHDEETACKENLNQEILDLINRQQAEIKEWKRVVETWQIQHEKEKAEIERLKKELNSKYKWENMLDKKIKEVKSEAVKEFAERLKERVILKSFDPLYGVRMCFSEGDIDNLVKGMVGDE